MLTVQVGEPEFDPQGTKGLFCFIMFSSWTCWHELLIPLLVRQSWTEAGVLMADQLVHLEPEVPERTWWKALKEGHPRVFPGSLMHTHKRVFSHHKTSYIVSGFQLQNKKHAYSPSGQAGASLRGHSIVSPPCKTGGSSCHCI